MTIRRPWLPWTRSHERLLLAWWRLHAVHAEHGRTGPDLNAWLQRKFGVRRIINLTDQQARQARRSFNAWRAGEEGWTIWNRETNRSVRA